MGSSESKGETDASKGEAGQGGFFSMIGEGKKQIVDAVIRPPRAEYDDEELGPTSFTYANIEFSRVDFKLVNGREQHIVCSYWQIADAELRNPKMPLVVYCHGNASCRLEALDSLCVALKNGCSLLSFDSAGSGHSDGEYVSLGYYEVDDLACVLDWARSTNAFSSVGLWGRSMGVVTLLRYLERGPAADVQLAICDSGFCDFHQLGDELINQAKNSGFKIPSVLSFMAWKYLQSTVKSIAGFDPADIKPIGTIDKVTTPIVFCYGDHDNFVNPRHSQMMFEKCGSPAKLLVHYPGDHNSRRPIDFFTTVEEWIRNHLHPDEKHFLDTRLRVGAPWLFEGPSSRIGGSSSIQRAEEEMMRRAMLESLTTSRPGHTGADTGVVPPIPESKWQCPRCTFINESSCPVCDMCMYCYTRPQPALDVSEVADEGDEGDGEVCGPWTCSLCTFENDGEASTCEMCGCQR